MSVKSQSNGNKATLDASKSAAEEQESLHCYTYTDGAEVAWYTYEAVEESANYLLERTKIRPKVAIICGSGLGSLADMLRDVDSFKYETIPHFPVATVVGHEGCMIFGYLDDVAVMCMQGRYHYYEGYPLAKCAMPVRVMKLIGVTHLIATNAAGGLNPAFKVGDIMVIKDHVNVMGFAGNSPLQGPNEIRFGPRFLPMNKAYNSELIAVAKKIGKELGIENDMHEGIYTCVGGPNYETVAELKMLYKLGMDAVGMSTVHEVVTAKHCDLTVFGISLITNKCVTDYDDNDEASHGAVVEIAQSRQKVLAEIVTRMIKHIHDNVINQE